MAGSTVLTTIGRSSCRRTLESNVPECSGYWEMAQPPQGGPTDARCGWNSWLDPLLSFAQGRPIQLLVERSAARSCEARRLETGFIALVQLIIRLF